jgi:hypothetical protein
MVMAEAIIFSGVTRGRMWPPDWWKALTAVSVPCPSASGAML